MPTKKNYRYGTAVLVLGMIGILVSCAQTAGSNTESKNDGQGTISLSISSIQKTSTTQSDNSEKTSIRSIGIANSIKLILLSTDGNTIDTKTERLTISDSAAAITWDVPAGSGYKLQTNIYNTTVSTSEPTVSGISDSFNITPNSTTKVTIICTPVSTTNLTYETKTDQVSLTKNSELWFSFTAISSGTTVTVDQTEADTLYYAVYDGSGSMVKTFKDIPSKYTYKAYKNSSKSGTTSVDAQTNAGGTCYVGIVATGGRNTVTVTISDNPQKTVGITSPVDGGTISTSSFTVKGAYTGSTAPDSVTVSFDATTKDAIVSTEEQSWTCDIDAAAIANGSKTVTVTAKWDSGASRTASVSCDYTGSPGVSAYTVSGKIYLPDGYGISSGSLTVIAISTEDTTVAKETYKLSDSSSPIDYTLTGIMEGTYTIAATAEDTDKNYTFVGKKSVNVNDDSIQDITLSVPNGSITVTVS